MIILVLCLGVLAAAGLYIAVFTTIEYDRLCHIGNGAAMPPKPAVFVSAATGMLPALPLAFLLLAAGRDGLFASAGSVFVLLTVTLARLDRETSLAPFSLSVPMTWLGLWLAGRGDDGEPALNAAQAAGAAVETVLVFLVAELALRLQTGFGRFVAAPADMAFVYLAWRMLGTGHEGMLFLILLAAGLGLLVHVPCLRAAMSRPGTLDDIAAGRPGTFASFLPVAVTAFLPVWLAGILLS